jgi:CheY-like chemotaxis protein
MPEGGRLVVASRNAILPATNATAASKAATGKATTGATATAGLVTDLPPGDYVVITVTDTGTGIDPDTLAHAFEPFFTTKDVGKGSGLGLSQVYGFTRGAGGDVVIDTTPGRGTTVALYFPRSNEPLAQPEVETPEEVPDPDAAGRTVLLVEDDDQVLAMALESLRELRYQVVVARNAGEALHHIRAGGPIDLMFSDVVMPGGMNGAQLAAEARKLRPDLRVLLTSGYAGGVAATRSVAETYPLLPKPYRRSDLANKLRTVMTGST